MNRLNESEQRIRAAELAVARAVAEREDAEAVIEELRNQLSGCLERAQKAEADVVRLRREVIESRDQQDELVEANAELVVRAERIKILEQRLCESQTSAAYIRELENSKDDLQRQLDDRDDRITSLLQKLGEIKDRQAVDVETEMLRLRLKHAEARLAEELQHREALERDVRSQQSVVQQMQIDKRIAEKLKKQIFQDGATPNGHGNTISGNGDTNMDPTFDVTASAITEYFSSPASNGENLGSLFQLELESARSQIQSLETKLREALMQAADADAEASRLKEIISRLHVDQDVKDTTVVAVSEAKAAAETALQQLTNDLATLETRLQFDFSSAGLVTPEAVRFAESVAKMLTDREDDVQAAWEHVNKLTSELQAIYSIEKAEKDVQTTLTSCLDSTCVSIQTDPDLEAHEERRGLSSEVVRLNDELVGSAEALASAREEISDLHDRLRELESECTQERTLSARAQHQLTLSQQEAWKVQAQLQRLRTKVAAHVEMLAEHGFGQHASASSAADLASQLKSITTHLIYNQDHQEEMFRENERLKEEVYALKIQLDTNRTIQRKLRDLNETSEFLESTVHQLLHQRPHRQDNCRDRNGHRRLSSPTGFSIEEEAQDTDADGLAYTDLSQFAPTSSSSSVSPRKPTDSSRWQLPGRTANPRRLSDMPISCASAPLARPPSIVTSPPHGHASSSLDQDDSLEISISGSLDGVDLRASVDTTNGNNGNGTSRETRENIFARLAELRRRNDLQPFHLRTNYPVETQFCDPDELLSVLRSVQHSRTDQSKLASMTSDATLTTSTSARRSPIPAGRSTRPRGLQSVSEVLLTGASGTVAAEDLDLSLTKARLSESALRSSYSTKTSKSASIGSCQISSQHRSPRSQASSGSDRVVSQSFANPKSTVGRKAPIAFEVELSPPRARRAAPPSVEKKGGNTPLVFNRKHSKTAAAKRPGASAF